MPRPCEITPISRFCMWCPYLIRKHLRTATHERHRGLESQQDRHVQYRRGQSANIVFGILISGIGAATLTGCGSSPSSPSGSGGNGGGSTAATTITLTSAGATPS